MTDQDRRAVKNMAIMGCELQMLFALFPRFPEKDVTAIWKEADRERSEYICNARKGSCGLLVKEVSVGNSPNKY